MIAINTVTQAVSRLTPPWHSLLNINGTLYGLSDTGLEKLEGPIEAGATPLLKTGKLNLIPGAECAIHPATMLISADGPLNLTVKGDEDGVERVIDYVEPRQASDQKRQRRIPLGRGSKSTTWSFELATPPGETVNWSVSAMAVDVPAVKYPRN